MTMDWLVFWRALALAAMMALMGLGWAGLAGKAAVTA